MRISMRLSGDLSSEDGNRKTIRLTDEPFWIGREPGPVGWRLLDAENLLSRRHCCLRLVDGAVELSDESRHGTSIGAIQSRLVRGQPIRLEQGAAATTTIYLADRARIELTLGDVEAAPNERHDPVWDQEPAPALSPGSAARAPEPPRPPAFPAPPPVAPTAPSFPPGPGSAPAPPPPLEIPPPPSLTPPVLTPEASDSLPPPDPPPRMETRSGPAPKPPSDPAPRTIQADNPTPAPPPSGEAAMVDPRTFAILAAAMGVDPAILERRGPEAALREIGASYRAMANALRVLLQARRDVKIALGVNSTHYEPGSSPLKTAASAPDAVIALLDSRGGEFENATAMVDGALDDLQRHQLALVGAVRAAVKVALDAFDPVGLETKMKTQGLLSRFSGRRKAALWDSFEENYRNFAEEADEDVRRVLRTELDRLYQRAPD